MRKRTWSIALTGALIASLFVVTPASAQDAPVPVVPEVASIEDPALDANTTSGDNAGPANVSDVGDLLKIWFTNTADKVTVNVQTAVPPPASAWGVGYRVETSPNADGVKCLVFRTVVASGAIVGESRAKVFDACNDGVNFFDNGADGELVIHTLEDGTGVTSMTFDRAYSPLLVEGQPLTQPTARSDAFVGEMSLTFQGFRLDDTKVGTDYTFVNEGSPGENPPPTDDEVGEDDDGTTDEKPKAKKNCKKKKTKKAKKKCMKQQKKNKPKPASCPAYEPGEAGAEAETLMVTDEATAEAPVTIEFDGGVGMGGPLIGGVPVPPDQRTHNYHNIQVDSDKAEVGLYVRIDFPDSRDYDLYILHPTGEEASHSGDFNAVAGTGLFICGEETTGCESGSNYEQVGGLRTDDCQGWTIDSVTFLSEGGNVTLSMWLGEIVVDPAPPGEG